MGSPTWTTKAELCEYSVPGVTLGCLFAVYNQELHEIISLGRCEVNLQCNPV